MRACASGSTRAAPVKFSAGATNDGRVAARVMTSSRVACASAGTAHMKVSAASVMVVCFTGSPCLMAVPNEQQSVGQRTGDYCNSLVNESEPNFQAPFCCTYTSVTTKGLVTSLPPTTASSRIRFNTIAVEPMNRTDASKISACL